MKRLLFLLLPVLLFSSSADAAWMPSVSARSTTVWAVGDSGVGIDSVPTANLLATRPFDRLFYLGDVYENGTAEDFASNYGFAAFSGKTAPTIGNHEWANRNEGYYPFWAALRGSAPPSYYSFWLSGWQILVLNSEDAHAKGSPEYRWLKRSLRQKPGQRNCRVVVTHRPRWSAGSHGSQGDMEPVRSLLHGRALLWLSGHDHNMQHIYRSGVHQFVSGAAGRGHYPLSPGFSGLRFYNQTDDGALRLVFRKSGKKRYVRWSFVSVANTTLASGHLGCKKR